MEAELRKLGTVWATAALSGCYCYAVSQHTQKGALRLLLLLPVLAFFVTAPYSLLTYRNFGTSTWCSFTWLGISKLLLLAFGTGPLAAPDQSLPQFVFTLLVPFKSQTTSPGSDQVKSKADGWWTWSIIGAKALGSVCLMKVCDRYKDEVPYWVMVVVYSGFIYLGLELILDFTGALARALLGIEVAPHADKPYLSTSLQDFWARRWNLMISDILRQTVHKPIRIHASPFIGRKAAISIGVFASFLVSGLMHEWLFNILIRAPPSWEVTWFFVLHGACLVIEMMIKEAIGNKWRVHPVISGSLTLGFVIFTVGWLHFPPVLRTNTHEKAFEEYAIFESFGKEKVMQLFGNQPPLQ